MDYKELEDKIKSIKLSDERKSEIIDNCIKASAGDLKPKLNLEPERSHFPIFAATACVALVIFCGLGAIKLFDGIENTTNSTGSPAGQENSGYSSLSNSHEENETNTVVDNTDEDNQENNSGNNAGNEADAPIKQKYKIFYLEQSNDDYSILVDMGLKLDDVFGDNFRYFDWPDALANANTLAEMPETIKYTVRTDELEKNLEKGLSLKWADILCIQYDSLEESAPYKIQGIKEVEILYISDELKIDIAKQYLREHFFNTDADYEYYFNTYFDTIETPQYQKYSTGKCLEEFAKRTDANDNLITEYYHVITFKSNDSTLPYINHFPYPAQISVCVYDNGYVYGIHIDNQYTE